MTTEVKAIGNYWPKSGMFNDKFTQTAKPYVVGEDKEGNKITVEINDGRDYAKVELLMPGYRVLFGRVFPGSPMELLSMPNVAIHGVQGNLRISYTCDY